MLLAAWRGNAPVAAELAGELARGASDRGEGAALTYSDYAQAVLYNSLGSYGPAAEAASRASAVDEIVISPWALYELAEGAARSDQQERARAAADRLSQLAEASGSNWVRGAAARSRALVSGGRAAEEEYREANELLSRTRMETHLARTRLVYGEWLRREKRRVDARVQLRSAFDVLASMGAEALAERARRELQATGETARKRNDATRADLTPQEEEIVQLARDYEDHGTGQPVVGAGPYGNIIKMIVNQDFSSGLEPGPVLDYFPSSLPSAGQLTRQRAPGGASPCSAGRASLRHDTGGGAAAHRVPA